MKPAPKGWPRITSSVFYEDASAAIDWLCRVFGFEVRLKVEGENGRIEHSELTFGDGLMSVSSTGGSSHRKDNPLPGKSPRALGGANTQMLCVYLDDVDAHHARVVRAGARVIDPPTTNDYGEEYWSDRSYRVEDLEGHTWFFVQRVREQK
ncbi:MAG TPA: VOC family protein [Polyangiales bacterium]|nr:VOC family protein [Polyangiales bacterium]